MLLAVWGNVMKCIRKYAVFSGRASRTEFWHWVLFVTVVTGVLFGLAAALVGIRSMAGPDTSDNPLNWLSNIFGPVMIVAGLFLLFCLPPTLAAAARRLRDGGFSPWLVVIPVVFLAGAYLPLLEVALSGMDTTPPEIPLTWCFAYLTLTLVVCLVFAFLLTKKPR